MPRNAEVERIAETHFMIRPEITQALRRIRIPSEPHVRKIVGDPETYLDRWQAMYGDRFVDMTTMVRLGTAIETGLRTCHRAFGGNTSGRGLYQRIVRPQEIVRRFKDDCHYDLSTNSAWDKMREIMVHRHLYAHNSGVVDEKYVQDIQLVTAQSIETLLVERGYPTKTSTGSSRSRTSLSSSRAHVGSFGSYPIPR